MATDEGIPSASTTLLLVLSGLLMAVLGEFVCYIFVYSKPQFIKLQQETTALWREFFGLSLLLLLLFCCCCCSAAALLLVLLRRQSF